MSYMLTPHLTIWHLHAENEMDMYIKVLKENNIEFSITRESQKLVPVRFFLRIQQEMASS